MYFFLGIWMNMIESFMRWALLRYEPNHSYSIYTSAMKCLSYLIKLVIIIKERVLGTKSSQLKMCASFLILSKLDMVRDTNAPIYWFKTYYVPTFLKNSV